MFCTRRRRGLNSAAAANVDTATPTDDDSGINRVVNAIIPTPNGKASNVYFGGENFDTLYVTVRHQCSKFDPVSKEYGVRAARSSEIKTLSVRFL